MLELNALGHSGKRREFKWLPLHCMLLVTADLAFSSPQCATTVVNVWYLF